jgi:hypothetical protein
VSVHINQYKALDNNVVHRSVQNLCVLEFGCDSRSLLENFSSAASTLWRRNYIFFKF